MACVQSVLTYGIGTETWAMKAENLHSLERAERMMVRWMCGVSLKVRSLQSFGCILNVRVEMIGCRPVERWR